MLEVKGFLPEAKKSLLDTKLQQDMELQLDMRFRPDKRSQSDKRSQADKRSQSTAVYNAVWVELNYD